MYYKTERYEGIPTVLRSYAKEFLVECPKCRQLAIITADQPYDLWQSKLTCASCDLVEKSNRFIRFKVEVSRYCDDCGKAFTVTFADHNTAVESIAVACPHCGALRTYTPKNTPYRLAYKTVTKGTTDPLMNLPLWLQGTVRGETLWAYNRQHLLDIRSYVASKLRERQTARYTTMVEKLPVFISSAKNRRAVLKEIDKLLQK
jgi:DNA-directed RNA polymerase subunit RPC12/RpoP